MRCHVLPTQGALQRNTARKMENSPLFALCCSLLLLLHHVGTLLLATIVSIFRAVSCRRYVMPYAICVDEGSQDDMTTRASLQKAAQLATLRSLEVCCISNQQAPPPTSHDVTT